MDVKKALALLILGYLPGLLLPLLSSSDIMIGGVPIVWFYYIGWVLYLFVLLIIAYTIDRRNENWRPK